MSDRTKAEAGKVPKRGEAAWKAAKDSIADRNEAARKAGMKQRQAEEGKKMEMRRAADQRERNELGGTSGGG